MCNPVPANGAENGTEMCYHVPSTSCSRVQRANQLMGQRMAPKCAILYLLPVSVEYKEARRFTRSFHLALSEDERI